MRGKTDVNQLHINCTNCTMTAGQSDAFGGTFVYKGNVFELVDRSVDFVLSN